MDKTHYSTCNSCSWELSAYIRTEAKFDHILPILRIKEGKPLFYQDEKGEKYKEIDSAAWQELFDSNGVEKEKSIFKELYDEANKLYKDNSGESSDLDFEKFKKSLSQEAKFKFYKRCDHRHHAIDAAIVALCSQSLIQLASKYKQDSKYNSLYKVSNKETGEIYQKGLDISKILPQDRLLEFKKKLLECLYKYIVWHKAEHFPNTAFFQETAYGIYLNKEQDNERYLLYSRTPLQKMLKVGQQDEIKTYEAFAQTIDHKVVYPHIKEEILKQTKDRMEKYKLSLKEAVLGRNDIPNDGIIYNGNKIKKVKSFYVGSSVPLIIKSSSLVQEKQQCSNHTKWKKVSLDNINISNHSYKAYYNNGYVCMEFYPMARKGEDTKKAISNFEYQQNLLAYKKQYPQAKRLPSIEYQIDSQQYQKQLAKYREENPHATLLPVNICKEYNDSIQELIVHAENNSTAPNLKKVIKELQEKRIPEIWRVFIKDIIFHNETKDFYYVQGIAERDGLKCFPTTEIFTMNIKSQKLVANSKKFILITDRNQIPKYRE